MAHQFGDVSSSYSVYDQATFKQRPAAIVSSRAYNTAKPDVVVMAMEKSGTDGNGPNGSA